VETALKPDSVKFNKVGLMTPGDMGQGVAMQIQSRGFTVCTALDGRSARSHHLAREAGLTDVGTIAQLVVQCEVVLSIMDPGAALAFARQVADALRATGSKTLIVDCNAIAPPTMQDIAGLIEQAGGRCLDAGIVGPPPRGNAKITLFVSGPGAADMLQIAGPQLAVQVMSERIGDASALKMCSGALTKGTQALWLEVLIAAQRLGVHEFLEQEVSAGPRAEIYQWVQGQLAIMPPKAYRWVPEMREVARTMDAAGITPQVFEGVAAICEYVGASALGRETPEQGRAQNRSSAEVVRLLAQSAQRSPDDEVAWTAGSNAQKKNK
jgi:3-hydroxyisobutyrate dehydrogenase-like beta-hydroxyacid dehydrogenase